MKAYLQFLNMFYTGLSVIKLMSIIGLLFFIPVFFIEDKKLNEMLVLCGFFLSIGLPYFVAAGSFRMIIANRRFSLIPGFHFKAGVTLFCSTCFISLGFAGLEYCFSHDPLISGIGMFICASIYILFIQLMFSSFINPALVPVTVIMLISFFGWLGVEVSDALFNDLAIFIYFFLLLGIWVYALYVLSWKRVFTIHKSVKNVLVGDATVAIEANDNWMTWDILKLFFSNKIASPFCTLLKNHPDNLYNKIIKVVGAVIVFPAIGGAFVFLLNTPAENEGISIIMILPALLLGAIISIMQPIEWIARARYLWLRSNLNRLQIWKIIDRQIVQFLLLNYVAVFLIAGLAFYIGDFPKTYVLYLMTTLISITLFYTYFSLFCKITKLDLILAWGSLFFGLIVIFGLVIPFISERFIVCTVVQLLLVLLGLFFRKKSRLNFKRIDWSYVKPARRVGGRLQAG